ncbi:MAG TPA: DinB family protein [Segetibacter sp.]|nr:DinB family protein [Segetibacter sp.]
MTSLRLIAKPEPGEYPAYTEMYMSFLPDDGKVLQLLQSKFYTINNFIYVLPGHRLLHQYTPGKWSIKETLVHIIDKERIFSYRALNFARNEQQNLTGFDQNAYTSYSDAANRKLDNIFEEYEAVRKATIALFNGLPKAAFLRMGKGTGTFNNATVRALAYHIVDHELHYFNLIKKLYLS